jgi:hypothetical protein
LLSNSADCGVLGKNRRVKRQLCATLSSLPAPENGI